MHDHGTHPEHFAAIAAKNWNHGALSPLSHRQPDHTVTVDEVLASRHGVAEPLTAMMACPADDGAACVIVALHRVGPRATSPTGASCDRIASALQSETYSPGHTFLGPVVGPATMTRDHGPARLRGRRARP